MPGMPGERHGGQLGIADLDPGRVGAPVKLGADPQARAGVVAPISSTTTWWLTSGRPRQFIEIAASDAPGTTRHRAGHGCRDVVP